MLNSFLQKSSFCANGQLRVFEITLRGGGLPQLRGYEILMGCVFIDIVGKAGIPLPPPFS